jgi:hypothetical protein
VVGTYPLKVVGFSMGASPVLIHGVPDARITTVIGIAGAAVHNQNLPLTARFWTPQFWLRLRYRALGLRHDLPAEVNARISPAIALSEERGRHSADDWIRLVEGRVFLVHAVDDKSIRIDKLRENAQVLGLPPDQVYVLMKGGHTFLRGELLLSSVLLRILNP